MISRETGPMTRTESGLKSRARLSVAATGVPRGAVTETAKRMELRVGQASPVRFSMVAARKRQPAATNRKIARMTDVRALFRIITVRVVVMSQLLLHAQCIAAAAVISAHPAGAAKSKAAIERYGRGVLHPYHQKDAFDAGTLDNGQRVSRESLADSRAAMQRVDRDGDDFCVALAGAGNDVARDSARVFGDEEQPAAIFEQVEEELVRVRIARERGVLDLPHPCEVAPAEGANLYLRAARQVRSRPAGLRPSRTSCGPDPAPGARFRRRGPGRAHVPSLRARARRSSPARAARARCSAPN